jgi:DNA topoisomerase-1
MSQVELLGRTRDVAALIDPREATRIAGLRYVSDAMPGIRRRRAGTGFIYIGTDERRISDPELLARIKSLAVPPAWSDVWICPVPHGHIQATGRDARGRKQYRYHPRWRLVRDETKFDRMADFGKALSEVRERVDSELALPGLPREKILATVVCLLDRTFIRVGNSEYARTNHSFGLTTMRGKHVRISGANIQFQFQGKGGKRFSIDLNDARLARIVKRCRDLPGYELFQYLDDLGETQTIDSADVNSYLREVGGSEFSAKDFRTWGGTVLALVELSKSEPSQSAARNRTRILRAIEAVADELGNTPSVCRNCYVHPAIIEAFQEGSLLHALDRRRRLKRTRETRRLRREELAVLKVIR